MDLSIRYVRNLVQQAATAAQERAIAEGRTPGVAFDTLAEDVDQLGLSPSVAARKSALRRSTSAFRGRSAMSVDTPAPLSGARANDGELDNLDASLLDAGPVLVRPPRLPFSPPPRAVGPYLLQPAPLELSSAEEPSATDLVVTSVSSEAADANARVSLLAVSMDDGRVDVCILASLRDADWAEPASSIAGPGRRVAQRKSSSSRPRSGRFTLSDSEDSDDYDESHDIDDTLELVVNYDRDAPSQAAEAELPILLVYESISLNVGSSSQKHAQALPSVLADPIYSDTIYAYHSSGAYAISFRRWASKLAACMADDPAGGSLARFLHEQAHSDLVQIIKTTTSERAHAAPAQAVTGLAIITDVYLSYSLLAVTADLQAVGIELDFRVEGESAAEGASTLPAVPAAEDGQKKAYLSLLAEGGAFTVPEPFKSYAGLPSQPRVTGQARFGKGEVVVTPDSLRFLGKTAETIREEIRSITRGGNACQMRLDLQNKEIQRQARKLADVRSRTTQVERRDEKLVQRFAAAEQAQAALTKRIDSLLQRLVVLHQPEISVYERKWFDELDRLVVEMGLPLRDAKGEAQGAAAAAAASTRSGSLMRKIAQLTAQLNLLRPELAQKKAMQDQRDASETNSATGQGMGESQMAKISQALSKQ